jgi:signal transduction histidine kinase
MQGKLYETLLEPLREKGTLEKEVQLQRKEGTLFPAFISLSLLFDEQGEPEGVVGYAVDISELRRREAELKRLAERLEASNRELESFSYSVSHDLRAPLRAIDGFSQALEEDYGDRLDETASDYLRRIRGGAQRLGILIDDLLQLSRVNREALRLERVDLAEMARSVIEELRATEPERQVELILDDDMVVIGDPRLMRAVVANLLGNAWKFTGKEPRGRIEFRRQASGQDVFCVRDNGVGFDMRHAGKLFGAFQRLHRASEFPGTGVGLATVQRIVHRHGGRVWAEAEPGKGARFCFSIGSDLQGTPTQLDQEETG